MTKLDFQMLMLVLPGKPALAYVGELRGLGLLEDIDMVVGHPLLSNQNLLAAIHHKIPSLHFSLRVSDWLPALKTMYMFLLGLMPNGLLSLNTATDESGR